MAARGVRWFVAVTAVVAVAAYSVVYLRAYADAPIRSDGYSYYVYLPATLLYHDPSLDALSRDWYGGAFPDFSAIRRWPATGKWLDACPIGVALMMLPFFLVADALSWWSNLPRDGFSLYYQHAAGLAGLAYFVAGLAVIRSTLRGRFADGVVLATLVAITWGTNLFHYGTYDATFSHAFSFFLIAAWIALVERWWERPTVWRSAALGGLAALIVLVRNVNAVFLAVLPLYGVSRWSDARSCAIAAIQRWRHLVVAVGVGAACLVPQALMYRSIAGAWWINSYALLANRFSFASPHLGAVLFSTEKGLFFWSPILLLGVIGAFVARGWARGLVLAAALVFAVQAYIVACWSDWQLGGSFGHRAFTDGLALAAPPLAAAFAWAANRPRRLVPVALFATATVLLSIAQMVQYWIGVLPIINTSWAQYRALFLTFR